MKKLVFESLDQLFEAKACEAAADDKPKPENVHKAKAKIEKTKATKLKSQPKDDKIKQAIAALEAEKKKAQKPGAMKQTVGQKKAKIAEIQKKIDAWKKKLA
jgi:hypothetical protein